MFTIFSSGSSATVTVSQSIIHTFDAPMSALTLVVLSTLVAGAWVLNARLLKTIPESADR